MTPTRVAGIVLAGGLGERFGSAKAFAEVGGMSLAARTAKLVSRGIGGGPLIVAAGSGGDTPNDLPRSAMLAVDSEPDAGPLAGLAAGLLALEGIADIAIVVPCDTPLLHPAFVSALAFLLAESDAETALLDGPDGRPRPFPGGWRVSLASQVSNALKAGERRPWFVAAGTRMLSLTEADLLADDRLAELDPQLASLSDADTRERLGQLTGAAPRVRVNVSGRRSVQRSWTLTEALAAAGADPEAPCTVNDLAPISADRYPLAEGDSVVVL